MPRELRGLEPGEDIRASTPASFRGATAASARATFALGSARVRNRAYEAWREVADVARFPAAGPEMVLVLTPARLLVCATTFWGGRAKTHSGAVALDRIVDAATTRHGIVTGLAIAFEDGQIVEVEALRGRRLRRFVRELQGTLAERRRPPAA